MTGLIISRLVHVRRVFFLLALAVLVVQPLVVVSETDAAPKTRELMIGIEPEHNIFDQMQRYRKLAEYLSEQLGVEVKLTIMSRYGEVVNRFRSLHLDGAILSSYTATLAIRELGLTPVVSLVHQDGESTSRGYILVRKDSGIKDAATMRDRSVVFVDPATAEGYLFARAFFRQHGIEDLESYFSRYYYSGSHASAIFAVLDGRVDVGAAKDTVYEQLVKRDRSIENELEIIAKSPPVPEVTLCIKDDLDPALLEKLQTSLIAMDQTAEGNKVLRLLAASRFVPSSQDDFAVVSELAEKAGVKMVSGSGN